MAEDTQGIKSETTDQPVAEPQVSPMPSEEEKAAEVPTEKVEQPKEGLPEDAKERTKREFDKLQTNLREERARREYYEQLFQQMQLQEDQPKFVDPITGLPDENALANLSKQSQQAIQRAEQAEKKVLEYQREQENKAVFAVHPELNPNDKAFNRELHNLTRSFLTDSMLNPDDYGGKELSFLDAAEQAKKRLGINLEEAKKLGAEEAIEQLTPKEQASLDAVGSPSRRSQVDNLDELRLRSRGESEEAKLARIERFKRIMGQG